MRIEKDPIKERNNKSKHGLSFALAEPLLSSPSTVVVYDRFEGGEERWHAIGFVSDQLLVCVHAYSDPDDDERIRVIGLRRATRLERTRYEEIGFG